MIKLGHATIRLVQESLIAQKVDIIVNPANTYLWMKHGISGVLKREGGDGIEREALSKGPIPLGGVVLTGSGSLPCGRIAHVAVMTQDLKVSRETVGLAVSKVLEAAEGARATSIAMPPLGVGNAAPPPEVVAAEMFGPMIEVLPEARSVRDVRICLPDEEQMQQYKDVLMGFFAG
ncbi:MAG: macro domain-containing protein [Candidatus Eisenbacteria bacterium]|nr:macro domain-containing protein [Candidatus Eisenbacteria bacterium]